MLVYEDTIMAVPLFMLSKSYYLMKDIGYYYSRGECLECILINKTCISNNIKYNIQRDSMKYIYFLSEKLANNKFNAQLIFNELQAIIHSHFNLEEKINIDFKYINIIFEYIIKKFKHYNNNQKHIIIDLQKRLLEKGKSI